MKFYRICAIVINKVFEVVIDKARGFSFPPRIVEWNDSTKRARERAAHAGMISCGTVTKKNFAEDILNLSVKTLERKKSDDLLDRQTSSHVIEVAKVVEHAFDVFEDEEKVQKWLSTPNRALNQMKPLDLFYMPTGLGMVNNVLGRIEEGVYS